MRIRIGDTVFVDHNINQPFVVENFANNRTTVYSTDGRALPAYRLATKGQTFAKLLNMQMNKKYTVDDYPYGVYIARERGIYEIVNGVEHDITNRLTETPLKDVLLKKKRVTEEGWVRLGSFSFTVSGTSTYTPGDYRFIV